MGLTPCLSIFGKHEDNEINCPAIVMIITADLVTVLWIYIQDTLVLSRESSGFSHWGRTCQMSVTSVS